jgi:pseudaminic acid synthase
LAKHLTDISIGKFLLGEGKPPFLIAEMSGNHNQSLERALQIVESAAKSGAHAVKLQTYTADHMTLKSDAQDFKILDKESLWSGKNLHDLYQEACTPFEWHAPLMKRAQAFGMVCFSSPFDPAAVDFLEDLQVPCYKIASFELTYFPLLKKIAQTRKPVILSTGMATEEEIQESIEYLTSHGCSQLILLKCTSTYPASPESTNIVTIPDMRNKFNVHVGLSDHTLGSATSVASVAFGAVAIEKHFTLRRADGGVDSAFSMEPEEFLQLSKDVTQAHLSLGKVTYGPQNEREKKSCSFRRSIYVSSDIKQGETLTEKNLKCVRPAFGLPTKNYEMVLGKKAKRSLSFGSPLTAEDFE